MGTWLTKWWPRIVWCALGIALGLMLLHASATQADTLQVQKRKYESISSLTAQAAYNGGIWTGWIDMEGFNAICFEIENDYTGNTGITFRCESDEPPLPAADAGFDITTDDCAGGKCNSVLMTVNHTSGAADVRYTKCIDNIPHSHINCKFDDEAGNNATDDLTVRYSLVSP